MRQYLKKKVFRIMTVTFTLLICLLPASAAAGCATNQNNAAKNVYVTQETTSQPEAAGDNYTASTADDNSKVVVKNDAADKAAASAADTAAAKKAAETAAAPKAAETTAASKAADTTAASTKANSTVANTTAAATKPSTTKPAETTKAPAATTNNSSVQDIERQVVQNSSRRRLTC
jgi:ABC-2 type transport system ATP-binding protein